MCRIPITTVENPNCIFTVGWKVFEEFDEAPFIIDLDKILRVALERALRVNYL